LDAAPQGLPPLAGALRPPRPHLIGRADAVEAARAFRLDLTAARPVAGPGIAFVGPAGCGKSTLLAALTADPVLRERYDIFALIRVAGQPWDDVLAQIFRALHAADGRGLPTLPISAEWTSQLRGRRVGIALDDADEPFDLRRLLNALPKVAIFATSREPLDSLVTFPLLPLRDADAAWLLEVDRPMHGGERDAARSLAAVAAGNPLRVKQLAALATARPPAEVARLLPTQAAFEDHIHDALGRLDPRQRSLLDAVGTFGPNVFELDDPGARKLAAEGLVVATSAGWRIAPELEQRYDMPDEFLFRGALNSCAATLTGAIAAVQDPSRLQRVLAATRRAGDLDRFSDVIDLGKPTGDALARCGAWNQWRNILDLVSAAAGRAGADGVQSWVLHQSGSRLACLGDTEHAQSTLRAALARRKAAHDAIGTRLTEHNLAAISGGSGRGRMFAGAAAAAAVLVLAGAFALRPHAKPASAAQTLALTTSLVSSSAPGSHRQLPAAYHPKPAPPHEAHALAAAHLAAAHLATTHLATVHVPAANVVASAPEAKPKAVATSQPLPTATAKPSPTATAKPRAGVPRTVALAPKPAPPLRYAQPEILAFDANRTLLTLGNTTRLCLNVRGATHVRLTASSRGQTRQVPLPAAIAQGQPGCIRIAPKSPTRYELHASSGSLQTFRVLAVDVFAPPPQASANQPNYTP
jgi:hypothetical protein